LLVLTRKTGETIVVGNTVRITIIELSPGIVRLGFDAPADVSIYRGEIHREIADANRVAATGSGLPAGAHAEIAASRGGDRGR
jgi:carbon storage regulator